MKKGLTVIPEDEEKKKKMFVDLVDAIKSGKDIVNVLAKQGRSIDEMREYTNIINKYGFQAKNVKIYSDKIEFIFKDEQGQTNKVAMRQFEVLGSLIDLIERRIELFNCLRMAYMYYHHNKGEFKPVYEYLDKQVKDAYYDALSNGPIDDDEGLILEGEQANQSKVKFNQDTVKIGINLEGDTENDLKRIYLNLLACNFTMSAYMIVALNQIYRDKVEEGCLLTLDEKTKWLREMLIKKGN